MVVVVAVAVVVAVGVGVVMSDNLGTVTVFPRIAGKPNGELQRTGLKISNSGSGSGF